MEHIQSKCYNDILFKKLTYFQGSFYVFLSVFYRESDWKIPSLTVLMYKVYCFMNQIVSNKTLTFYVDSKGKVHTV